MRHYEQIFILKPTLTNEENVAKIESIKENIVKNGGEIIAFDNIGSKKLAYKIEKNKRGYYGVFYFKIAPNAIRELERLHKISEDVLKFMTVKYETKKEITSFNNMIAKFVKTEEKVETKSETETNE
jgi:small subunit ribosomal protein S6